MEVLVAKNEDGELIPGAFIYPENRFAEVNAEEFLKKHKGWTVVRANLIET